MTEHGQMAIEVNNRAVALLESQFRSDLGAIGREYGKLNLRHGYLPKPLAAKPPEGLNHFPSAARIASLRSGCLSPRVKCGLPYIASEADLEQWLDALRDAAKAELKAGNRISL